MMVDKTIFIPEELDNIPLYKLRLILRDLGGTPGSKNIREIKQEIIDIQLSGDFDKGEKYVLDNFVWTEGMEKIASKLRKISKTLNGTVKEPLANRLLKKI